MLILLYFLFTLGHIASEVNEDRKPCNSVDFGYGSPVCMCNSTYCDSLPRLRNVEPGTLYLYETTKAGKRMQMKTTRFGVKRDESNNMSNDTVSFQVNTDTKYQRMMGFGGAFTEVAGENILSLPEEAQDHLLRSYFSTEGLEYTFGRIPIASCDYSTHVYSYDDHPDDFSMSNFSLVREDYDLKIALMKRAQAVSPKKLKFIGGAWGVPFWMKETNDMVGPGEIKEPRGPYFAAYAKYLRKFLDGYKEAGIEMWGITPLNQPSTGFPTPLGPNLSWQMTGITAQDMHTFTKYHLIPELVDNGYENITLMAADDIRSWVLPVAEELLSDPDVSKHIPGIATHWYLDDFYPAYIYAVVHRDFPDKFFLGTEACMRARPSPGSWEGFEKYANDILEDIFYYHAGWMDWNLALDMDGGPNLFNNNADSPIIVNATAQEFYKQPTFYVMAHFSKFIPEGSCSIGINVSTSNLDQKLESAAFLTPDDRIVLVIFNKYDHDVNVTISTESSDEAASLTIDQKSLTTAIFLKQ